jgi:hypothetical protein
MTVVTQLILGSVVLGACALIQVVAIVLAVGGLKTLRRRLGAAQHHIRRIVVLLAAFAVVVAAHTVQVWIWAASFMLLGALPPGGEAIYFAIVTYTTLGYGDVVVGEGFRIFAAMAAVTGLLAFGLSTAFLVGLVSRMLSLRDN